MAVGNVVQTPEVQMKFGAFEVTVPSFIAKTLGLKPEGTVRNDGMEMPFELDEECYLGKDGDLEDCADFDPKVSP